MVEKLKFDWHEVHEIAEELEHIKSDELINRLDAFLGNPKFDPHGDPIPTEHGKFTMRRQQRLDQTKLGRMVEVLGVLDHSKDFLTYLNNLNIQIGTRFMIKDKIEFDQSLKIVLEGQPVLFTHEVCQKLLVHEV